MEGLIKGLINVALNNNNNQDEESSSQSRDERSRSTWAQVVSGDQDKDEEDDGGVWHADNNNRWNRNRKEDREEERNETAGERHSRRPHKEEGEEKNDGWENVSKRHSKQPTKVWMDHSHGYKRSPSEQEYADDVGYGAAIEPSKRELEDLSQACSKLWELDSNRLVPGRDYEIDCGKGKKAYQKEDMDKEAYLNGLMRTYSEDQLILVSVLFWIITTQMKDLKK